ncbi:glycosyltransferase family 2 protein [Campylobacter lari]|uniref:glycosyltransferase family 2 protein n=1 Tax=Campylobacter lari TaxID=201 RepID=UPI000AE58C95|nr:glycosyltransferase family 2 protein [Campylobacter lari]
MLFMKKDKYDKPLVSIIMPTFNRQNYIGFAIESILNQSYLNFEFIIIDDCSTDATYNIIQEYAKNDKRIVVLRNERNRGIVYSLNKCMGICKGKYIARMDDDDISLPERIEKQVDAMERDNSIIVAGCYFKPIGEDTEFFGNWVNVCEHDMIKLKMMFECSICHPTVMIRAEFLKNHNLAYSYKYQYAEDYKLWTDIIQKGGKIINIPETLLLYRISNFSISRNKLTSRLQQNNSKLIAKHYRQFILGGAIKNTRLIEKCSPLEFCKKQYVYKLIEEMQINGCQLDDEKVQEFMKYFCGSDSNIHVCFIYKNMQLYDLVGGIFSVLNNSIPLDHFCFYVLHEGDFLNEQSILNLRKIKDFEIKIIDIRNYKSNFKSFYFKCLYTLKCINVKKCILIDSKIIAKDSLNQMWNIDLEDKAIAAVAVQNPLKSDFIYKEFMHKNYFERNILIVNLERLFGDNLLNKILFLEKTIFIKNDLISKDEVIMNIVYYNHWKNISLRYNIYNHLYLNKMKLYNVQPVLISYLKSNSCNDSFFISYVKENHCEYIKQFLEYDINNNEYTSAVNVVKNSLSYKIGLRIIQSKTIGKILTLPFSLINIIYQDHIEKKIGDKLKSINVNFGNQSIDECYDFIEGEKIKRHLAYQLGECFLKHPIMFIFYSIKIYIKWKNNEGR